MLTLFYPDNLRNMWSVLIAHQCNSCRTICCIRTVCSCINRFPQQFSVQIQRSGRPRTAAEKTIWTGQIPKLLKWLSVLSFFNFYYYFLMRDRSPRWKVPLVNCLNIPKYTLFQTWPTSRTQCSIINSSRNSRQKVWSFQRDYHINIHNHCCLGQGPAPHARNANYG